MEQLIVFRLQGKRRAVLVQDGERSRRSGWVLCEEVVELPAAQAVWDQLSQRPEVELITPRPE